MDSILNTTKKLLGIQESDTNFDDILVTHINSVFAILNQLGVGPKNGFYINGSEEKWSDFISEEGNLLKNVQTYMYMKVRLVFDPPTMSAVLSALKESIAEYESRINMVVDPEVQQA
jgi:hypothetical protein